jgi:prepilin-type N-terminal cleavage/methylation domain-containing protein/prepilin-type processing-associated H-X9-DG protein
MKMSLSTQRERGLTLVELLVVMVIIAVFAAMIIPANTPNKARAYRIQCVNNLKQISVGDRLWIGNNKFPMAVSTNNGGSMEFVTGGNSFRHFLAASNEFQTPKLLFCPAETDYTRIQATTFSPTPKPGEVSFTSNSNLSYFVGIDAGEDNPNSLLCGDRNITNCTAIKNGILEVSSNWPAGWTAEMHNKVGNILLADGSVQQLSGAGLRTAIGNTSIATNRLQMPVLGP